MGRFLGITVKRVALCRCLGGHIKEPYEISMAWEPNRRSNFFSPPAHLYAVTYMYMTEILLNVRLSNRFQSHHGHNIFLHNSYRTRHVFVKHGCPQRQQSQNMAKSLSYILTPPDPQGHEMSVKCEEPIDELTVQVWLLYDHPNFKY